MAVFITARECSETCCQQFPGSDCTDPNGGETFTVRPILRCIVTHVHCPNIEWMRDVGFYVGLWNRMQAEATVWPNSTCFSFVPSTNRCRIWSLSCWRSGFTEGEPTPFGGHFPNIENMAENEPIADRAYDFTDENADGNCSEQEFLFSFSSRIEPYKFRQRTPDTQEIAWVHQAGLSLPLSADELGFGARVDLAAVIREPPPARGVDPPMGCRQLGNDTFLAPNLAFLPPGPGPCEIAGRRGITARLWLGGIEGADDWIEAYLGP